MAQYRVRMTDDREMLVNSDKEEHVAKQVSHQETTRISIAAKRGLSIKGDAAVAKSWEKVKP